MKSLVFETPDNPKILDQPIPKINDTEVLVQSRTVGICHSDYELLAGRYIIPISYPVIPGHEWCGEIVEVGKNVKHFKKGDRVVGECVVKTPERLHHFGFSMNGADREFFNVNPDWLHKLPDSVDDNRGALIEPFTCGFYAVLRSGGTNASETVVVSGGGTIGLVTAAAAIGMGARVIVVDPIKKRRDIAVKLGAAEVVDANDNPVERIKELTGGKGAELVVEASGHDASVANVFEYAQENGRVSMVGLNIGRKVTSTLGLLQLKNLTVRGCIGSPGVWPAAIKFLERTGIDLSPIQTHHFGLMDAAQAFELGKDPQACIKVTLSMKGLN
jgi:L-iditol 2-dehydrogenase